MLRIALFLFLSLNLAPTLAQETASTQVLVIGGGTGGTAAGIQSARMGEQTMIVEGGPWLGGMISSAGVSAIDGNHQLASGLWAEFREGLYKVYGGPKGVETGWVSNTLFEPHVADSIFKSMAANEPSLKLLFNYSFQSVVKEGQRIISAKFVNDKTGATLNVKATVFIDATDLGDVIKAAGVSYDVGMEAGSLTGETVGIKASNKIVQDLTYVAILKDYGFDQSIPKPLQYNPAEFDGACTNYYKDLTRKGPTVDAKKMLDYGRLPHNKYMINWPNYGNDTYLDIIELTATQRKAALEKAKQTTLRFIYFIQQELGFKNLGLADDEFPTADKLALIPYYREGRRVKGLVRMTMGHIATPFSYGDPLYRTGIAVGDYPIDHHHKKNQRAPQHLAFYPIPSFNVPLGALITQQVSNLIIAEKGISVSNVVNGTTRLQPCVLLTGQAAGTLAALSSKQNVHPAQVAVRSVQSALLKAKAYIMPYVDVQPNDPRFEAIQKIGATGLLKGTGIPYKWANQTWFYPDSLVSVKTLLKDVQTFQKGNYPITGEWLSIQQAIDLIGLVYKAAHTAAFKQPALATNNIDAKWKEWGLTGFDPLRHITRAELAVLFDNTLHPFERAVNHQGYYKSK
ncbi:MAG TPA: FAD-dependent oxidoreductase [Chitinophagaceae bacterium]|nr:FAD-dependent oxidoreductase [Chitinophagaceae bacterium]